MREHRDGNPERERARESQSQRERDSEKGRERERERVSERERERETRRLKVLGRRTEERGRGEKDGPVHGQGMLWACRGPSAFRQKKRQYRFCQISGSVFANFMALLVQGPVQRN